MFDSASPSSRNSASDSYFDSLSRMQAAISTRDFNSAASLVRQNVTFIPGFVQEFSSEYGSFDITSIPSLEQGGKVLALVGDKDGLLEMQRVVGSLPTLEEWAAGVEKHLSDLPLFNAIQEAVSSHPNCLQADVKGIVGEPDGHRIANLISYLEKAGKIVRTGEGRTYRLGPPGSERAEVTLPRVAVKSHRNSKSSPNLVEIDISSLSFVSLPRSPLRWEEKQSGRGPAAIPDAENHFEVFDAEWHIESMERIPMGQRPDPAFRLGHPNNSGLILIDDLGKSEGLGAIEAAAMRYDRTGKAVVKAALQHGTYRIGVHPLGRGLVAMSKDCVVHAYDDDLELILETSLKDSPEIRTFRHRFEMVDDQLKNHVRCVALSQTSDRYIFTAVDEAWCIGVNGQALWGAKLPLKEGWTRVTTPSSEFRTSDEVNEALTVMGLSMPFTSEALKLHYRELVKQVHPDLNPGDPQSNEKMKAVNLAAEALTGIDVSALPAYTEAKFVREFGGSEFEVKGFKFSMVMTMSGREIDACDWIYAASFAANSDSVYLAGYSGCIVLVDDKGLAVRAYDIGSVPRRIVDTGDYLYLLTDTRLYVLQDDSLYALIDTFNGGDLFVTQTGFALVESKRVRWFLEDGEYVGSVVSKDPIRRVYSDGNGMVVETRQRRAVVRGVPEWWE